MIDNPNLILFDDNKNNLVNNEQNIYSDINEALVKESVPNNTEVVEDDRNKLLNRLMKGNFIEKTAISCLK